MTVHKVQRMSPKGPTDSRHNRPFSQKNKGKARTAYPLILMVRAGIELVLTRMNTGFIPRLTKF